MSYYLFTFSSNAHVEHYKKLNRIKFDIYRNNQHIGSHIFSFNREGEDLKVKSIINFKMSERRIEAQLSSV